MAENAVIGPVEDVQTKRRPGRPRKEIPTEPSEGAVQAVLEEPATVADEVQPANGVPAPAPATVSPPPRAPHSVKAAVTVKSAGVKAPAAEEGQFLMRRRG